MMTAILRLYLALLSFYHVITGVISFAFPGFAMRFYKAIYGTEPAERRQLTLVMKPWGSLAIFAGLCGGFAAVDPVRYRGVVMALLALMILRTIYRIVFRQELEEVGRIAPHRNWISIASIEVGIVILAGWLIFACECAV